VKHSEATEEKDSPRVHKTKNALVAFFCFVPEVSKLLCPRRETNDGACASSNEHSESVVRQIFATAKI